MSKITDGVMSLEFLLRALRNARCIRKRKMVHGKIVMSGFLPNLFASNHLMSMYVRCDRIEDARRLFDQMPEKNVVSWTILISGYSKSGPKEAAVRSFRSMALAGFSPNDFTYVSVLSACASIGAARSGKEIHGRIYRLEGGVFSSFVSNSLVNLYAKCGMIHLAHSVFDGILQPNMVSWGSILSGYCQCGENEEALRIFSRAWKEGVEVNEFMVASVLSACSNLGVSAVGKQVHCYVIKSGIASDQFVEAGVIDMYVKCNELDLAYQAFSELDEPGLASWAALIAGYAHQGHGETAMGLFRKLHSSCLKPNEHIFPSVLVGCSIVAAVEEGKQLHSLIIKSGFRMAAYVGNAVMDFYAKCGLLDESFKLFEEMEEHDIVSYNAMIARYADQCDFKGVMEHLKQMLLEGINPNPYTYSSILKLCADLPVVGWGQQTHNLIIRLGLDTNVIVGSALIDMYAKCGRLEDARKVFHMMPSKNLVSWNSMLVGYAQHGFGVEALGIFHMMQMESVRPNEITFIGVLSACAHAGLVEQGQCYFDLMKGYGIIPSMDHFACMVDLFSRAGLVERAYEFIKSIPIKPNKVTWRSLMAGCKTHGNLGIGLYAAEQILKIDPEDVSAHVMLSGVYAHAGMWDERAGARAVLKMGLKKVPGCSWI
ncbi:pentatricopeptide repeat-containing protein At2g27610 [Phoenix dactylifera]|uniref:Pentatricopeptide repeat-containing protein At2g27610 n=1 Tax=Phoenix dactylifera TaxID=42345 RepID=A0A8B8J8Z4_PHODC|nr:pentatricopeptide repeat-containing protein At2g27610 [Phoenix dactylifera]XP_026663605.1 pentatricopeptide repeat-containing protein At2g27610 [Phoenix dactylifera]XP_026663606.1 pentatricopeptide repeat-containing protein At2g27610 [Phoenix dactylifera]XP_026663607.1 pentatricopeptide repeat-containing protein At2g27610 [Phoenix dactylifera]XP_026663608.1 pentatricopeptide repeat-containing protein At2g27610 [Phoenix dactylifera]XP_026663609.1 pentatricopeptide repeat-containing protein A